MVIDTIDVDRSVLSAENVWMLVGFQRLKQLQIRDRYHASELQFPKSWPLKTISSRTCQSNT